MSDWPFLMYFSRARRGRPLALASLVGRDGSSYRQPGARMLIDADGYHAGSLSGGCLEEGIAKVGCRVIASGEPELLHIDTRPHFGCPGKLRILVERLDHGTGGLLERVDRELAARRQFRLLSGGNPAATRFLVDGEDTSGCLVEEVGLQLRLVMIGSASDGEPLLRFGSELAWDLHRVTHGPATEVVVDFPPDPMTAVLVMTHHLASDLDYLKNLLPHPYRYIGLLGSRRRRETLLAEAGACGLLEDPTLAERLFAPVGLDLGGGHPTVIALAVAAEIQAVFSNHAGGFLRDRLGSIHGGQLAWK
jgi:xanthine dehydrogenase accessory factor